MHPVNTSSRRVARSHTRASHELLNHSRADTAQDQQEAAAGHAACSQRAARVQSEVRVAGIPEATEAVVQPHPHTSGPIKDVSGCWKGTLVHLLDCNPTPTTADASGCSFFHNLDNLEIHSPQLTTRATTRRHAHLPLPHSHPYYDTIALCTELSARRRGSSEWSSFCFWSYSEHCLTWETSHAPDIAGRMTPPQSATVATVDAVAAAVAVATAVPPIPLAFFSSFSLFFCPS